MEIERLLPPWPLRPRDHVYDLFNLVFVFAACITFAAYTGLQIVTANTEINRPLHPHAPDQAP